MGNGSLVKLIAKVYFFVGVVAAFVTGMVFVIGERIGLGLLIWIVGTCLIFVTRTFLDAFGELVENTYALRQKFCGDVDDDVDDDIEHDVDYMIEDYDEEKEQIYIEATIKMQRGSGYNTTRFYKEAIELLEQVADYKDSAGLIDECNKKIKELSKN